MIYHVRNVEKRHRFWGARALGSWQSIQIACRLQESVREDIKQTSATCCTDRAHCEKPHISKLVSISQLLISLLYRVFSPLVTGGKKHVAWSRPTSVLQLSGRLVAKCDLQIARATHNFAVHGPVGDMQICPWYIVCSLSKYYECTGAVARSKHVTSRFQYCFNGFWMSRHVSTMLTKFFNRHLAGPWSVSRSQRCVVSEFLYVVLWSFKCC